MLLPFAAYLIFGIATAVSDAALPGLGLFDDTAFGPGSGHGALALGIASLTLVASIVQLVVTTLGGAVLSGFVALNVRLETLGHRATSGELWAQTRPAMGRLLGFGAIVLGFAVAGSLIAGVVAFFVTLLVMGALSMLATSMIAAVVALSLVLVGLCVPILWLTARLSLAPSVIVFEGAPAWAAIRRSWQLTHRSAWRIVGLQVLLGLMAFAVFVVLALLSTLITDALFPFAAWEDGVTPQAFLTAYLPEVALAIVAAALTPVSATLAATIYVDARVRTDWLAASLQHFHAGRAQGYAPAQLADPFVTPPPAPSAPTNAQSAPPQAPPPTPQWEPRPADPTDPFDSHPR